MTEQFPVAGQPYIYVGVEKAPGGGKKLMFVSTHQRVSHHISISQRDYDTMIRDAGGHPEEWCGAQCGCEEVGFERGSSPPLCREGR